MFETDGDVYRRSWAITWMLDCCGDGCAAAKDSSDSVCAVSMLSCG